MPTRLTDPDAVVGQPGAKAPSDSDIRLEGEAPPAGRRPGSGVVTEEIDLDAEAAKVKPPSSKTKKGKQATGNQPVLPTSSPFELSEPDVGLPEDKGVDSSEDFNLTLDDSDETYSAASVIDMTGRTVTRSGPET